MYNTTKYQQLSTLKYICSVFVALGLEFEQNIDNLVISGQKKLHVISEQLV